MVKAVIITVNYRGTQDTLRLLENLRGLSGFQDTSLIIVDNASQDDSFSKINEAVGDLINVRCIAAPRNLGYFGAARWALDNYLVDSDLPNWVIVCNNDVVFPDVGFLNSLLEQPNDVGAIAPRIVSARNGYEQNPFMPSRPGRLGVLKIRFWFSRFGLCRMQAEVSGRLRALRAVMRKDRKAIRKRRPIYAPHGACIIFSRRFFEQGGYIDNGTFLYGEEIGVAEVAMRLGLSVIFEPSLQVLHNEHRTTGRRLSRATFGYKRDALQYLLNRYWQDVR